MYKVTCTSACMISTLNETNPRAVSSTLQLVFLIGRIHQAYSTGLPESSLQRILGSICPRAFCSPAAPSRCGGQSGRCCWPAEVAHLSHTALLKGSRASSLEVDLYFRGSCAHLLHPGGDAVVGADDAPGQQGHLVLLVSKLYSFNF